MAREFNGSNQYLSASSTLLTDEPIDMLCYFNSDDVANPKTLISLGDNGASGFYRLIARGNVGGDPVGAHKRNDAGSAEGTASSSSGYTSGAWFSAWASFITNTSRAVGINGGSKGTDTTNVGDPTPDFMTVAALRINAVSQYFDGKIAEVYVLDANMSDDQHAMAGMGISPFWFMPVANIRAWYPLLGNDNNNMANGYPDLTPTNSPTQVEHPANVFFPQIGGEMSF